MTIDLLKLRTRQRYAMPDDFVDHVRLRRVHRRRVMTNVLRAQENAISQILEKHTWLDQSGYGLESKAADRVHPFADFAQLRNTISRKTQLLNRFEILGTRMRSEERRVGKECRSRWS